MSLVDGTVLFVGESPPPGAPAGFRPFDCASGTRLARNMLGLVDRETLLEHVPLANLFDQPTGPKGTPAWPVDAARDHADALLAIHARSGARSFVLLGSRVAAAFGMAHLPGPSSLAAQQLWPDAAPPRGPDVVLVRVPHPSGASTAMNAPEVVRDVRRLLLPELVLGCPALRPWHFRLDDPAVAEDLAVAVAPLRPSAGYAALEWANSKHKARLASPPGSLLARIANEAAKGCDGADLVIPPWDESLARVAADLLLPDGVERLSVRWDEGGGPKPTVRGRKSWLASRIDGLALSIDALAPSPIARATVLRYALGGLGR